MAHPLFQLPLLLIGLIVAAYWYRVLRMARKQRRRTGRAANLVPAEPLGRALRLIWTPIIILWISLPIAAAVLPENATPTALKPLLIAAWLRWLTAACVMAGYIATRACWRRMGAAWRMGIDPGERNPLVLTGPFGYVRHPIYTLSAGMMAATLLALPSPLMLIAGLSHIALLCWESSREERHLLAVHGAAYADYQRHVGRLFPRSFRRYGGG